MKLQYPEIARRLIAMREADLALRDELIRAGQLHGGYNEAMRQLHHRNADELHRIMQQIGIPSSDKVGADAADAAWLVVQHAIERPVFMKAYCNELEKAVAAGRAEPRQLAYLSDRIAVFEGRPQLYGTQFDWDETGQLAPQPMDDPAAVNRRRKAIGLNSLDEQTLLLRERARAEGEAAPEDPGRRRAEMNAWRRSVGWI